MRWIIALLAMSLPSQAMELTQTAKNTYAALLDGHANGYEVATSVCKKKGFDEGSVFSEVHNEANGDWLERLNPKTKVEFYCHNEYVPSGRAAITTTCMDLGAGMTSCTTN